MYGLHPLKHVHNLIWCCMKLIVTELDQERRRAVGMVIVEQENSREDTITLWRYSSGWFPATCIFRCGIDSIGSGRNVATGHPVTLVNDEVVRSDPNLAAGEVHFEIVAPIEQLPPFLLLSDTSRLPVCRKSRVLLHVSRLADLPDVRGECQFLQGFTIDWAAVLPEFPEVKQPTPYWQQRLAIAEITAPYSGLWLPFEFGPAQGAMQLGERHDEGGVRCNALC